MPLWPEIRLRHGIGMGKRREGFPRRCLCWLHFPSNAPGRRVLGGYPALFHRTKRRCNLRITESKEEHFVTENGKEKKATRTRRSPAGEKNRQQDQVLSGAADAPKIGKIAGPKKTAAKKTTERTAQRGRGKAESKKTETKKTETKKTAEKAASTGKKKTETGRKAPARGSRKPQKPAISQTAAQLEAIRAQQEAQEKRATRKGRGGRSQKSKKPPI